MLRGSVFVIQSYHGVLINVGRVADGALGDSLLDYWARWRYGRSCLGRVNLDLFDLLGLGDKLVLVKQLVFCHL